MRQICSQCDSRVLNYNHKVLYKIDHCSMAFAYFKTMQEGETLLSCRERQREMMEPFRIRI